MTIFGLLGASFLNSSLPSSLVDQLVLAVAQRKRVTILDPRLRPCSGGLRGEATVYLLVESKDKI